MAKATKKTSKRVTNETKGRIVSAAWKLFYQYGYNNTTIDDIVEESENLGELYCELAERKGCRFADAGKWNIEMTFDGVHFSPEGHSVFAKNLEEILKQI